MFKWIVGTMLVLSLIFGGGLSAQQAKENPLEGERGFESLMPMCECGEGFCIVGETVFSITRPDGKVAPIIGKLVSDDGDGVEDLVVVFVVDVDTGLYYHVYDYAPDQWFIMVNKIADYNNLDINRIYRRCKNSGI